MKAPQAGNHALTPGSSICAVRALAVHKLVADSGVLDLNSTYAYVLLCTDFADSSIVAERDGRVCGFIGGYHPPQRPDVLFVWQVVVAASERGTGLGGAMLDALVHRIRSERGGHPVTAGWPAGTVCR